MRGCRKDLNTASTATVVEENPHTIISTETIPVELDRLVDNHHPLVLLSDEIDWKGFERLLLDPLEQDSNKARLTLRTMLALNYLKQKYQLTDNEVIRRAQINPYWQHFCGMQYFTRTPVTTPTKMEQWRKRIHIVLRSAEVKSTFRTDLSAELFSSELFASQLFECASQTPTKPTI